MDEITYTFLQHKVANALMRAHGFDRRNPDQLQEFNTENPHSQINALLKDADVSISTLLDELMKLEVEEESPEVETLSAITGVVPPHGHDHPHDHDHPHEHTHSPKSSAVSISSSVFIFMETPPGEPTYVSDVREWLYAIEDAGIPDDTEVEGTLHLGFDREHPAVSKIECGDCGEFDTVLAEHVCPAWEDDAQPKLF